VKKPWRVQPLVSVACLLSAFAQRERGDRSLAERPAPGDGAPPRDPPPPAWHTYWFGRIGVSCVPTIESRVWGCGVFQSGLEARRGE
jgi:hypothetical protein